MLYLTSSVDQWMPWCCIQYQQYNIRLPSDIFIWYGVPIVFHSITSVYISMDSLVSH